MADIDSVQQSMLAEIPDTYKKMAGYPAYDFTRAFALAVVSLLGDAEAVLSRQDVSNLAGQDLDTYIEQHRGLQRKYGGYAETDLTVVTGSGEVYAGALFSTAAGIQFICTEDKTVSSGSTFHVIAEQLGTAGNVAANTITYMPVTVPGISAVTNAAAATGGSETESDLDFYVRFLEDLRTPVNGGNQASYIYWATSIDGVGRAKCFPQANGANTVELCITSATMEIPTSTVVAAVQAYIDPNSNGDGSGAAPIGSACTVTACTTLAINISMVLTLTAGASHDTVVAAMQERLTTYLKSLAFTTTTVSYAQVSNVIHDTDGVQDFEYLRLNGGTNSITLGARQVPILGTVTA